MRSVIEQSVELPAKAEELYAMYLDPARHEAITGAPVTIGPLQGAPFQAFGGQLSGVMLATVPGRLVVQSWRSMMFHEGEPDSTLILTFSAKLGEKNAGRIDLIHLDVPDHDYQGVIDGWEKYYWIPWRRYLTNSAT